MAMNTTRYWNYRRDRRTVFLYFYILFGALFPLVSCAPLHSPIVHIGSINRLQIFPGNISVSSGKSVILAALALDSQNHPFTPPDLRWRCYDKSLKAVPLISTTGIFEASQPGRYLVLASTNTDQSEVFIDVVSSPAIGNDLSPNTVRSLRSDGVDWDETNISTAFEPSKRRGPNPINSMTPLAELIGVGRSALSSSVNTMQKNESAGKGEFTLTVPILNLPGRGSSLTLNLYYNSLLWHQQGVSDIFFDKDNDWPAPGWSFGFGKLVRLASSGKVIFVGSDGTKHPFDGVVDTSNTGDWVFNGHTTDGTFIDYKTVNWGSRGISNAIVKYPDGTKIAFTAPGDGSRDNEIYPTQITDSSGNVVKITYRNNIGPYIENIIDTIGRVITFHYDTDNRLTSITAPSLYGSTREVSRFHYKLQKIQPNFSDTISVFPYSIFGRELNMLDAVFYPSTASGYWFGDGDSFSSYGMLRKVSLQRSMGFSGTALTDMGMVTPGKVTRQFVYNYPSDRDAPIDSAPTYTRMTETWEGMDTPPAVTKFETAQGTPNQSPRVTKVIYPDGTSIGQSYYNKPGRWDDGLIYSTTTYDAQGLRRRTVATAWEQCIETGNACTYQNVRSTFISDSDDLWQNKSTAYTYGPMFNQISEIREIDFDHTTVLRRKNLQYENDRNYIDRHIFNLPKSIELYQGTDSTPASRTELQYDNLPLVDAPGIVQYDVNYNPYAPRTWIPTRCWKVCEEPQHNKPPICYEDCEEGHWEGAPYDETTKFRGNNTQITHYADAVNRANPITETKRYDITGNLISTSISPYEQTLKSYAKDTQYAYPTSIIYGATDAASPVHLSTSTTYDFNTGLPLSATDANGRTVKNFYDPLSLRVRQIDSVTDGTTNYQSLFAYDDDRLAVTKTIRNGDSIAAKVSTQSNGLGMTQRQSVLSKAATAGQSEKWEVVLSEYNVMGRLWKQSLPSWDDVDAQSMKWTQFSYDWLGRSSEALLPDGSSIKTLYNGGVPSGASNLPGSQVQVIDPWQRERWSRFDALGRLVEAVQGDSIARYDYNALDKLILVTQGVQQRKFRYDSLGRLTHQYLSEKNPTLDDSGKYIGNSTWSNVFAYDDRSNLIEQIDARGVKTVFHYDNDPLNRIQSVTYDTTGFGDTENPILPAADIKYEYMPVGDVTRLFRLTVNGITSETYDYNNKGLLKQKTRLLAIRPNHPFTSDYEYDSFDRLTDQIYPAAYWMEGLPRQRVHQDFDIAGQVADIKVDGFNQASSIIYDSAGHITSLNVGNLASQSTEQYDFDAVTGLLTGQRVLRDGKSLLDYTYDYLPPSCTPRPCVQLSGRTGQLTRIVNNLTGKNYTYDYDMSGRLSKAVGSDPPREFPDPNLPPFWRQQYNYDQFGNRISVNASRFKGGAYACPPPPRNCEPPVEPASSDMRDGLPSTAYDEKTNRISTPGFVYDAAGNMTRLQHADGSAYSLQYDAAGRMVKVRDINGKLLYSYIYGADRKRILTEELDPLPIRTFDVWEGDNVIAEYRINGDFDPYVLFRNVHWGNRLLSSDSHWHYKKSPPESAGSGPIGDVLASSNDLRIGARGAPSPVYFQGMIRSVGIHSRAISEVEIKGWSSDKAAAGWILDESGAGTKAADYSGNGNNGTLQGGAVFCSDPSSGRKGQLCLDGQSGYVLVGESPSLKMTDATTISAFIYPKVSNGQPGKDGIIISKEGEYELARLADGSIRVGFAVGSPSGWHEIDTKIKAPQDSWTYIVCVYDHGQVTVYAWGIQHEHFIEHHHPDRLGTRIITNEDNAEIQQQATFPFGVSLASETSPRGQDPLRRRFTSYDREIYRFPYYHQSDETSRSTNIDYAVNRFYDSEIGRFLQPDPLEMGAVSLTNPQSLNMYSYVANDPVNGNDPNGLMFREKPYKVCASVDNGPLECETYLMPEWIPDPQEDDWQDSGASRRDGSRKSKKPLPVYATPATACQGLAQVAQVIAEQAISSNPGNPGGAIRDFDWAFNTYYNAGPFKNLFSGVKQFMTRGEPRMLERNSAWWGETGFRGVFLDTGDYRSPLVVDQTHHFSMYLSAGINNQSVLSKLHASRDNAGDSRLGMAAFQLGAALAADPQQLGNVGSSIISTYCSP